MSENQEEHHRPTQSAEYLYVLGGAHLVNLERFTESNPTGGEAADQASEFLVDVTNTVDLIRKLIEEKRYTLWEERALRVMTVVLEDRVARVRKYL